MHRVSVFGHRPEYVNDPDFTKRLIQRTIELIEFQYGGREDIVVNVVGGTGINQWVAERCRLSKIKYHMFVTCPVDELSAAWYEEQKESLSDSFKYAWATTIYSEKFSYSLEVKTHRHSIDMSDFVIAFWNGKKQGTTYDSVKYALSKDKIILNGYEDLKLITNEDL